MIQPNNPTNSDILFHFTGIDKVRGKHKPFEEAFETLKNILESKELLLNKKVRKFIVRGSLDSQLPYAMACLTETPLNYLSHHMEKFGKFGLGFSMKWGLKNGAQNVIYCDNQLPNIFGKSLASISRLFAEKDFKEKKEDLHLMMGVTEDIKNRDEREWRFLGKFQDGLGAGDSEKPFLRPTFNIWDPSSIKFDMGDIEILICPEEYLTKLEDLIQELNHFAPKKFKIQSSESILNV